MLSDPAQRRKRVIQGASVLPPEILARWAEFGVDELNTLSELVAQELESESSLLRWNGFPSFDEVEATLRLPWNILRFSKHDMRSAKAVAHFANRLRKSSSMRDFLDFFVSSEGLQAQKEIDQCFNFIRGAEYTFPQVFRALNDIVDAVIGAGEVDYSVYAAQLQGLFIPGDLRTLDEYGVPIPIIQRLTGVLPSDDFDTARQLVVELSDDVRNRVSQFEARLLRTCLE